MHTAPERYNRLPIAEEWCSSGFLPTVEFPGMSRLIAWQRRALEEDIEYGHCLPNFQRMDFGGQKPEVMTRSVLGSSSWVKAIVAATSVRKKEVIVMTSLSS